MPPVWVGFDGWSPGGGYFGEGWSTASNLYPGFGSVGRPWRMFAAVGSGVTDGPMQGAHAHLWASGLASSSYIPDEQTLFTGSTTKLYSVVPSTGAFTNRSRGAGYSAAGSPAAWRYASVGNDIFATNWLDAVQRRTNNTGAFADGFTSTFKPIPRFLATIREHLVGANLTNAGRFQDEVVWSDADNAINFDPPTGTSTSLAGSKRLASIPGQITGLLGGQYGLAFKRGGIFYLEYTGTTQVLRPDILSDSVGCAFPSSIIRTRHGVFFLGSDGFYQISGLSAPIKISPPGVDSFLLATDFSIQPANLEPWQEDTQAQAFSFAGLPLVGWGTRDNTNSVGMDKVLLYDPVTQRWGHGDAQPQFPAAFLSRAGGSDVYDSVSAFLWDDTTTTYARYSRGVSASDYQEIVLALRFRSANFEQVGTQAQSVIHGVLPIFSKTSTFAGSAVPLTVNLNAALDPFQTGFTTEGPRTYAQRDPIGGWYPFKLAGRFFQLTMLVPAALLENFHGVWLNEEPLS